MPAFKSRIGYLSLQWARGHSVNDLNSQSLTSFFFNTHANKKENSQGPEAKKETLHRAVGGG